MTQGPVLRVEGETLAAGTWAHVQLAMPSQVLQRVYICGLVMDAHSISQASNLNHSNDIVKNKVDTQISLAAETWCVMRKLAG